MAAGYNLTRSVADLLAKTDTSPASFTIELYVDHWTLNKGSKFLYNNPVASLLDDIRQQRIPPDFLELFDASRVPFYDGCLIVELFDHRPHPHAKSSKDKDAKVETDRPPERTRVVLHPTTESLWADICLLNQKTGNKWTDEDALQVEASLLLATTSPLCLDPDPHLVRAVNSIIKVSTPPAPKSLKRKAVVSEPEEHQLEVARKIRLSQYMNPKLHRPPITPTCVLSTLFKLVL
ncbi:hypothetical protein NEOLEDRAFT_1065767 [Neolentinus lepideus HHB14362 ss-1]|uniref:Spt20-like SEP domain-containing protein n=1 Tax=Neolentinus lepideus HHB14362 ss-1 TaxID=1314782 RepID=A0A165SGT9_9AGAM|nr:hypothetical protein NEOLEDRAFT_1065767 [Neolentinus lepideus HHB14362 ss-1]